MNIGPREYFELEKEKIKPTDRLFLLNKASSEVFLHHQEILQSFSILISLIAVLMATFAVVLSSPVEFYVKAVFGFIEILFIVLYYRRYRKFKKIVRRDILYLNKQYDELFKYHFDYARKTKPRT